MYIIQYIVSNLYIRKFTTNQRYYYTQYETNALIFKTQKEANKVIDNDLFFKNKYIIIKID